MLKVFEEVCKNRHNIPEQLMQPQTPSPLDKPKGRPRIAAIEGFFCKKNVDKKQLQRYIEELESASETDKDERLVQLKVRLKESVETIDVHREAQELQNFLEGGRQVLQMNIHPQPSFDDFSKSMRSARERNVRLLHLAGHGELRCGFLWLKNQAASTEYEEISLDTFVQILKTELAGANGGTIECVVLNACETEEMGKKLIVAGVSYVVCWRSEVQDNTAREFALQFYASLNEQDPARPRDYRRAFEQAAARISSGGGAERAQARHLAVGAVDYVCLLSESGNEYPDTGHIRQGQESENDLETRCLNDAKGEWELKGLAALGYTFTYNGKDMKTGIDMYKRDALPQTDVASYGLQIKYYNGFPNIVMSYAAAWHFFGVSSYASRNLWKNGGPICNKAMTVDISKLDTAIDCFKRSLKLRAGSGRNHGHDHMFLNLDACVRALEAYKNARISSSGVAATRRTGPLGTQDTCLAADAGAPAVLTGAPDAVTLKIGNVSADAGPKKLECESSTLSLDCVFLENAFDDESDR
jgi:hypothetical protein